jgi:hypothetical protein
VADPRPKLAVLLRARDRDGLDAALEREVASLRAAHPQLEVCRARRVDDPRGARTGTGIDLAGYDAALELAGPDGVKVDTLAACVEGLAARLGSACDATRSALAAGVEHCVLEGRGPLQLYYCMRRVRSLEPEAFHAFWLEQFSAMGRATPGIAGYRQLHVQGAVSRDAARAAGLGICDIDGVALEWFADWDALQTTMASAPARPSVSATEREFNDVRRAQGMLAWALEAR